MRFSETDICIREELGVKHLLDVRQFDNTGNRQWTRPEHCKGTKKEIDLHKMGQYLPITCHADRALLPPVIADEVKLREIMVGVEEDVVVIEVVSEQLAEQTLEVLSETADSGLQRYTVHADSHV